MKKYVVLTDGVFSDGRRVAVVYRIGATGLWHMAYFGPTRHFTMSFETKNRAEEYARQITTKEERSYRRHG